MRFRNSGYLLLLLIIVLLASYIFQDKKTGSGKNSHIRYEMVKNWPNLPPDFILGNPTGLGIDSRQNIFIFHRAEREWPLLGAMPDTYIKEKTILLLDGENGKILNSWGDHLFIMPHGLTVDNRDNVWVTDVGLHQVFKFSHEGKLLLKLGEAKMPGNDTAHFNRPTDVAVANDGSFYVSDGYGNSRVVKFSPDGKYLLEWGNKGNGQSEFNIPHGIDLDANGNVYVADRENSRVQVFDAAGRFLKQFTDKTFGAVCSVVIDKKNGTATIVDDLSFLKMGHRGSDIIMIDTGGTVQTRFGRSGFYDGPVCWYHDLAVDSQQNIYAGDISGNKVQKFRRISSQ